MSTQPRSVDVGGAQPYRISIGPDLLADGERLATHLHGRDAFVVSDDQVAPLYLTRVVDALRRARPDARVATWTMPAGEASKTLATFAQAIDALAAAFLPHSVRDRGACPAARPETGENRRPGARRASAAG